MSSEKKSSKEIAKALEEFNKQYPASRNQRDMQTFIIGFNKAYEASESECAELKAENQRLREGVKTLKEKYDYAISISNYNKALEPFEEHLQTLLNPK